MEMIASYLTDMKGLPFIGQLNNGAEVVASCKDLVLAKWDRGNRMEYVTWIVDKKGNAYLGHYFCNVQDAVKDFIARRDKR